jgi:hypothetical protein
MGGGDEEKKKEKRRNKETVDLWFYRPRGS